MSTDELTVAERVELRRIQAGLDEAVGQFGVDALGQARRVVYLALWSKAVIDNGGFTYFASGPHKIGDVALAFEALSLADLADACRQVVQLFPHQTEPDQRDQRLQLVKRYADDGRLAAIEDRFWETSMSGVERAALAYVRSHGDAFGAPVS